MTKRPADFTAQIQAEAERKRLRAEQRRKAEQEHQRKTTRMVNRQAAAYGKVVWAVAATSFDIDQIAGILLTAIQTAKADPQMPEVWRKEGHTFFRSSANSVPGNGASNAGGQPQPDNTQPAGGQPTDHQPTRDDDDANKPANGRRQHGPNTDAPASSTQPPRHPAAGTEDLLEGIAPPRSGQRPPTQE